MEPNNIKPLAQNRMLHMIWKAHILFPLILSQYMWIIPRFKSTFGTVQVMQILFPLPSNISFIEQKGMNLHESYMFLVNYQSTDYAILFKIKDGIVQKWTAHMTNILNESITVLQ